MNKRRKICVVTGSRAEYGLLYWILHDLKREPTVELQLVVTGMHLSNEFGMTVRDIESDGFGISKRVEMLVAGDTPSATAKSIALGIAGMSEALAQLNPDIVIVLGDRFEIFAAVQACLVHGVPIAHIAGGDTTEGAYDESIRHAITKMSHVHFVTNGISALRVRQMGEDPSRIHLVGSPGLDQLKRGTLLSRRALEESIGARLGSRNLLITFHPVTLEPDRGAGQAKGMLEALRGLDPSIQLWFTLPNADTGGAAIKTLVEDFAADNVERARVFTSLGHSRYLSLMSQVDAVVGNSSSGLYEAPSFGIATVDIGTRQKGRLAGDSVVHCDGTRASVAAALERALNLDCKGAVNPYGDGDASRRIVRQLVSLDFHGLINKSFHPFDSNKS